MEEYCIVPVFKFTWVVSLLVFIVAHTGLGAEEASDLEVVMGGEREREEKKQQQIKLQQQNPLRSSHGTRQGEAAILLYSQQQEKNYDPIYLMPAKAGQGA